MMKIAVILALAAACSAQVYSYSAAAPYTYPYVYGSSPYMYGASPYAFGAYAPFAKSVIAAPTVVAAPALVKSQYHAQDPMTGSAAYGHVEFGQAHNAIQDAAGNKVGSFSHVLPDGSISRTDYVADAMGYRVASNSLPISSGAMPIPVSDTAEVMAARAAHFAEVEKVKSRSKRAITYTAGAYTPVAYSSAYAAPLAYSGAYAAPLAYSGVYSKNYATPAFYSGSYYGSPAIAAYSKYPYYY